MRALTRSEVREVDRRAVEEFGLPGIVLMENAGRGAAESLLNEGVSGRVVICCGKGNNGGDGFVIARHLENAGVDVQVLLFASGEEVQGDAGVNLGVLKRAGTPLEETADVTDSRQLDEWLSRAEWIVDALLGTGIQGEVREPYASIIEAINRSESRVLAVDLPSGLDCDTGRPLGPCIRAERTVTFVAAKAGFDASGAERFTGAVEVVGIGVPRRMLTSAES
ncbi:MAG: NAD(P)H-hydrate epimerase [Planctomycetota bacterium]|nr:MAG: NAD(P)H-hydrate epimerase [Planctomycetota bacterium]REJ91000.1 MAG: NAD(P)H-hydrate epimerase [Planctomycetota bacterium]REK31041.1 MAG: NAD(P)H-hydrate epimerase [Planctomycetota bacterium]REK36843.1 MAG: NAD(P)H-hydrate epimerase [Planctomycetota bacterium]